MKLYNIPEKIKTIIFDIDGTLYTNSLYVFEQVDAQIRHYAHISNITEKEARDKINAYRKQWSAMNGGKKISLGNTFTAFGISIETSIQWRNELLNPEHYLKKDTKLIATLKELSKSYSMICVTNNPVQAARKTLQAIGVDGLLPDIIGLDTCKKSKPAKEVLDKAAMVTNSKFSECISVGDRYDIDLALPLQLGMGGILVTGVEEVYTLEKTLADKSIQ
ncbi:MAG: HAD family hydrolase [Treponema sp.]|nr:HAD family hydrolase [Treponema sp.]